jgi:hypothetical protein
MHAARTGSDLALSAVRNETIAGHWRISEAIETVGQVVRQQALTFRAERGRALGRCAPVAPGMPVRTSESVAEMSRPVAMALRGRLRDVAVGDR